ncbi:DUF4169 family protein [Phenylobacterium sp.]|jgi:hypothetical protein|uniref:DUF4169 family protein n=1 Tax=Phenylobacterium sp. TaxID=1871053 RepID=UPI002E304C00|nr:DUF4169 family protein [Phenylobacterium sp.]HEX3365961.1 DUF4169 family protein [Phenylobacterium sp.]
MVEPINLNKVRKARAKADAQARAAQNRGLFGIAKPTKLAAQLEAERKRRELEAKKRED